MARSINQVILMGNLTRDPEVRQTSNGQSVCSFSLALNRSYRDQNNEWQEATDYIDIVAWGQLGERVGQYLSKGRKCLVQGRLQTSTWEQDNQKRKKVEVIASDVTFLDNRSGDSSDTGTAGNSDKASKQNNADVEIEDITDEPINLDDIPF